jgi:hypothetical protein
MQATIGLALDDPSRSSAAFAAQAVAWAQGVTPVSTEEEADAAWMRQEAVFSAAMIAMRDGDAELRSRHAAWTDEIFAQALQTKEQNRGRSRAHGPAG